MLDQLHIRSVVYWILAATTVTVIRIPSTEGLSLLTHCPPTRRKVAVTYQYFAIGSNMLPATMTSLRQITPYRARAAILRNYELVFIGTREPAPAAVQQCKDACVHGVLYELSETDFGRLGQSEGVPWFYQWEACRVVPYVGDNKNAGQDAIVKNDDTNMVHAYVLSSLWTDSNNSNSNTSQRPRPSRSYMQILQDGAAYWNMDHDYQTKLQNIQVSTKSPGFEYLVLQAAKWLNPRPDITQE